MGRPVIHTTEELLDAAVVLAAAHGPDAVTMAALVQASGASSGSVYHRFANRGEVLGHVWLRTTARFQAGFIDALDDGAPIEACVAAARFVVGWSRRHAQPSRVLLRGAADFAPATWPDDIHAAVDLDRTRLEESLGRAASRLGGPQLAALERVVLATVDIPSAAVRRHQAAPGGAVPRRAEALVERAARAVLG